MKTKRTAKRWSDLEVQWLVECAPHYTVTELSKFLDRPYGSVSQKLSQLEVGALRKTKAWTTSEVRYLRDNCGSMTVKQLSSELKRRVSSVSYMLERMNLTAVPRNHFWSGAERSKISKLFDRGIGIVGAANEMGHAPHALRAFVLRNPDLRAKWETLKERTQRLQGARHDLEKACPSMMAEANPLSDEPIGPRKI